jgi:hypothetical protein
MALLVAINLIHLPDKLAGVKSNSRSSCKQRNFVPNEVVQKPLNHRGGLGGDKFTSSECGVLGTVSSGMPRVQFCRTSAFSICVSSVFDPWPKNRLSLDDTFSGKRHWRLPRHSTITAIAMTSSRSGLFASCFVWIFIWASKE